MPRFATFMSVKPGSEERYREEHRRIWREVLDGITRYGFRNYSIFMAGAELYSYFEVDDLQKATAMAVADPANQRWQAHMADFFLVSPGIKDGSTVYPIEVWHAEGQPDPASPLARIATLTQAQPAKTQELQRAYENAPRALDTRLAQIGIHNYNVYLIGDQLFTYFEARDAQDALRAIADDAKIKDWQKTLAPLLHSEPPIILDEVFHLD